ncbi:MAG: hypothetical protein ACC656_06460 [Candidatus Heimdallarchaeota archaeon]
MINKINAPYQIKYFLVNATRQKQIVKLNKPSELYSFVSKYDVILTFNDILFERIDDTELCEILILQEIDRVTIDIESGRIRTNRPDMTTFSGIIKKFGWEKVARANQIADLASSQQQDQLAEEFLQPEAVPTE